MDAVVPNTADDRALFDFEDYIFVIGAVGRILDTQLYILKELRIPKSLEVAAQGFFVVGIAVAAEDAGFQRVAAHAAVADENDAVNDGSGWLGRRGFGGPRGARTHGRIQIGRKLFQGRWIQEGGK